MRFLINPRMTVLCMPVDMTNPHDGSSGAAMLPLREKRRDRRNGETDLPACGGDVSGWRIQRNAPFWIYG